MNRELNKLFFGVLLYPIYLLGKIIPKSENMWIFGAWYGNRYSDNTSYLFEYVIKEKKEITAVWLSDKREIISNLRSKGFKAFHKNSILGFYYGCRAAVTFVNCGYSDVNMYAVGKSLKVQLWHGIPLKKIKYDDKINENKYHNPFYNGIKSALLFIFPFLNDLFNLIISSSKEVTLRMASAFRVDPAKIIETGYPRMDRIFAPKDEQLNLINLRQEWSEFGKIILYAPTHRKEGQGGASLFDSMDFQIFNEILSNNNAAMFIKMHYHHELNNNYLVNKSFSNIIYLEESDVPDINNILPFVDVLITDYSGVLLDYLILDKPIIPTSFDLEDYIKTDRELYEDYSETVLGANCNNWDQVQNRLQDIFLGNDLSISFRKEMSTRYFKYLDTDNCKRIIESVTHHLNLPL